MIYRDKKGFAQTADAIVFAAQGSDLSVLVVERLYPPYQNCYAFPGGFLDEGEDPLAGCLRELEEETSLKLLGPEAIALTVREKKGRDPRGLTRTFPYLFHIKERQKVVGLDDAREALWIKLTELEKLAFDHGAILCEAVACLWKEMPHSKSELAVDLPTLFQQNWQNHHCFYGGTFNPWHEGHSECVGQVEALGESITVLPDSNPLKELREGECFWTLYKAIAQKFAGTKHSVYPGFLGMEKVNPTAHWVSRQSWDIHFIFGDDNLFIIEKWIDYSAFLQSIKKLYIIPREFSISEIEQRVEKLSLDFEDLEFVILDEHRHQEVSSTKLREL
jgi:nicotinate-nucleotide adenylyltransferase